MSAFDFIICCVSRFCARHCTGCKLFLYYIVSAFDFIICFVSCFLRKTLSIHYFYITLCQPLILLFFRLLLFAQDTGCTLLLYYIASAFDFRACLSLAFCARRWLYTVFNITLSCVSIYNVFSYGKSLNLHDIGCTFFSYDNWLRHYFRPYSAVRCHLSREPRSSRRFFSVCPSHSAFCTCHITLGHGPTYFLLQTSESVLIVFYLPSHGSGCFLSKKS